ncbi:dihydroxyacetone kinase family protein [Agilicoccus flavus]|uniref:dihydroxyacetone kinase family protein n=1 Tax=Agilicoccus flavus TaxID=2775968 RepID=UPI001CF666F1|nr:dihydroxyacetone kinase family protein [Agilicoccus flavus]
MKKLINDPADVVPELLEGVALTQPGVALLAGRTIAVRADAAQAAPGERPVAIVSGGGAGHEPAHAGYVAEGMITAAVVGGVFASPSVDAVLDAIRAVTGPVGALLVVKNYTGDRLNFGMAAELARSEGLDVEMVVVGDDVALAGAEGGAGHAGRRGLAGTVLVHKVAGAFAARGADLAQVASAARRVAESVGTMSVALTGATVPGSDDAGFDLADDEVELGLGIHGEPGVSREKLAPADDLVATLVERVATDRGLSGGDRVVALVGTAGGTSPMDLAVCTRAAARAVEANGLRLERLWSGPVMTSIDMVGVSVTLLRVDDDLLAALDAPTGSLSWPGSPACGVPTLRTIDVPAAPGSTAESGEPDARVRAAVDAACAALLDARDDLDRADRHVGDGDLGSTLARGARAWRDDPLDDSAPALLRRLSSIARRDVGGTSGPLYAILFLRAAEALDDGRSWPDAFRAGVAGVRELGGAEPGDGTMVDALAPAAQAADEGWDAVLEAARRGAESTREGTSSKGRASYVGDRAAGYEDPGATAVVLWLEAVRDSLR